tara:strand:+ start:1249 stop:1809 length:561 start_codon:yes stop_codon:yes gene_type:complete
MNRSIEIVIALILSIILILPLLIIYILILFSSNGTPIFWSDRVGLHNKIFKMPKFRTMNIDTPIIATHLMNDPKKNITRLGSILRKYSLDEIPQIYSILKGDLSFVGPRPALYNQKDLIELRTKENIHRIKPGITGWAQVNGRDKLSISRKVQFDLEYYKCKSLRFDLYILFLTFIKILKKSDVAH